MSSGDVYKYWSSTTFLLVCTSLIVTTASANNVTYSTLTLSNPAADTDSSLSYTFELTAPLEVDDIIVLVLPMFSFGVTSTPTMSGCGGATFGVVASGSGTSTATLTFTSEHSTLDAGTQCTMTVSSGVTTSAVAQSSNLATRTVAVTLSNAVNVVATAITTSTAVVLSTQTPNESLTFSVAPTDAPTNAPTHCNAIKAEFKAAGCCPRAQGVSDTQDSAR